MAWTILVEDHQRNISAKLYGNQSSGIEQEDFYIFQYRYIGKISPDKKIFKVFYIDT